MAARLGRILFNSLVASSLVLCVTAMVFWVRSHRLVETYWRQHSARGGATLVVGKGRLVWYEVRKWPPDHDDPYGKWNIGRYAGEDDEVRYFLAPSSAGGPLSPPGSALEPTQGVGFGGFWFHSELANGWSRRAVMLPWWFVTLASGMLPLYRGVPVLRGRREAKLARQGRCTN